ncbi:Hsp70 family protein [Butyrivibrio sp. MC2013]|uniref:Hsp70 family protein n=1 Tax=Butyrivibrio sp. MC2013 TaxID=1280686 RepID=UPI000403E79D|nr:Hsp70 family protein [Butyrivibrio sp. MC2013]
MIIGIDLGTTNSLAAYFDGGMARVIPNRIGEELTPSVVSVNDNDEVLVGKLALEYGKLHPLDCARVFKRSMGTPQKFKLRGRSLDATELSSLLLRSLKEDAEEYLGCIVDRAIISVPAYFNDMQRKTTAEAGKLAGLEVVRIINEPSAAALTYGVGEKNQDERCLVFDLGGGTLDVSILEYSDGIIEVHAIAGDNFIGGEDFTKVLAEMFLKKSLIAPEDIDAKTKNIVMAAAEKAKVDMGGAKNVTVTCKIDGQMIEHSFSSTEYEENCEALKNKIRKPVEKALRDSGFKLSDIDRVLLVGGTTKMAMIRNFVAKLFLNFPETKVDPDKAVAIGAGIACGMKERSEEIKELVFVDVCPYTLGTEVMLNNGLFDEPGHFLPIIERNTVIPVSRTQTVVTARDDQSRVCVKVLQGESRMATNNLLLGEITVPVPLAPAGHESIDITYTYDVNSLLEIEVQVNSTGKKRKIIIQKSENKLTKKEAEERFELLQHLKRNPKEDEENSLLLLRGERLYEECCTDDRYGIDQELMKFERILAGQDRRKIETAREELEKYLDTIESQI